MKRYTGNYLVRWTDKQNKPQRKVYSDYSTALKAKNWLVDNGIDNVDIAIELKSVSSTIK